MVFCPHLWALCRRGWVRCHGAGCAHFRSREPCQADPDAEANRDREADRDPDGDPDSAAERWDVREDVRAPSQRGSAGCHSRRNCSDVRRRIDCPRPDDDIRGHRVELACEARLVGTSTVADGSGCASLPPGSYTDGVSVQQTSDGGYIVGGGTIGCGSSSSCPSTSGIQCALVEKVDQNGRLQWSYAYPAGPAGSSIRQISKRATAATLQWGARPISTRTPAP